LAFAKRKITFKSIFNSTAMKFNIVILLVSLSLTTLAQQPSNDEQIAGAVQAAPESQQEGAMVYGYDGNGDLIVLRKGTNELICLADNPQKKGFNVACYHKDLEPFMARSRALRKEGKSNGEIFDIKEKEAKAGTLKLPKQPTTLHILSGSEGKYNPDTGKVENANYRYVVYIPYATQESSGLPLKPVVNGGPWLMDPGSHRAHIMISTPKN
jgi:hypothetical protein